MAGPRVFALCVLCVLGAGLAAAASSADLEWAVESLDHEDVTWGNQGDVASSGEVFALEVDAGAAGNTTAGNSTSGNSTVASSLKGITSFLPTGFPPVAWHPVVTGWSNNGPGRELMESNATNATNATKKSAGYGPSGFLEGFTEDRCNYFKGGPNATKPKVKFPLLSYKWTRIGGTPEVNVFAWWNPEYSGLNIKVQSPNPIFKKLFQFKEVETKDEKEKAKDDAKRKEEGKKRKHLPEKGEEKIIKKFSTVMKEKDHLIFEADSGCFEKCKFIVKKVEGILDKMYSDGKRSKEYTEILTKLKGGVGC